MNWPDRIRIDPAVLVGKPVVKGTRLSVDFIVGLLSEGWSEAEIMRNYPGLVLEDIRACLAYARERLADERVYPIPAQGAHHVRILANENIPGDAVDLLRDRGHDVAWIRTESPGVGDDVVLRHACAERRILITFDKDYGERVFRLREAASCGIVIFRFPIRNSADAARAIADALESRADWGGSFSVVEDQRVRMRPLPGA